jgi:hypothetical protein
MLWVRTEALLSLIAIAMAFISGVLVLSVKGGPPSSISVPALEQEIQRFIQSSTGIQSTNTHLQENNENIKNQKDYFNLRTLATIKIMGRSISVTAFFSWFFPCCKQ